MSDLDKARVWAECVAGLAYNGEETQAAADVIQSLPDHIIDAEKLREVVSKYEGNRYVSEIVQDFADLLPAPKLPTLADMTAEEREACKWIQARLEGSELDFIIPNPGHVESMLWEKDGTTHIANNSLVTPLPDLPKLKWPGDGVVDCEIMEERIPQKLSHQQDYRNAPVGTVVQHSAEGSDVFIKTRDLIWRNINTGEAATSFKMSGDIRKIVNVIEDK